MASPRREGGPLAGQLALMMVFAGAAGLFVLGVRSEAQACGGLFCNARPPDPFAPLPVAQNGENVVFAITKDPAGGAPTLQAHIQILYTGDAAKFSWVVPVDAEPKLSTGTDRLFAQLAAVTQPRFQTQSKVTGTCIAPPFISGSAGAGGGFASGTGSAGTSGAAGNGGVTVSFQGAVGPFDAAVIKSDDAAALKKWLSDNGYIVSDAAAALIDTYVREQKYFVALKLLNGVGVRSIQPIVLTFRGTEACVPLRLTAIAANPDMPVLVWVLGDKRVAPRGFYEIEIDEARIDWLRGGSNYFGPTGLLSQAANEAGGNAFIAEYAGSSNVARGTVYLNGQIDLTQLRMAMTPPTYVQLLVNMGLANDSLMLPLLAKYIPMPAAVKAMNVSESTFYGNLATYWNQFAFPAYDLAALTDAISTSIVTPRLEAQMMIDGHPYLTRLNTFISPEEMNKDPFFFESKDLPEVPAVRTAVLNTLCGDMEYMACNAPQRLELRDGRMIWVRAGVKSNNCQGGLPDVVALASLPAAEIAWERDAVGVGTIVMDNRAKIQAGIKANNQKYATEEMLFPTSPTGLAGAGGASGGGKGGSSGSAGVSGGGGTESGGPGGGGVAGGTGGGGNTTTVPPGALGETNGGGCSCDVGGAPGGGLALALLIAAGLGRVPRRDRRRR
jgi:MYXO-CTERM domain-containing protein